jgi:hypothetical protein
MNFRQVTLTIKTFRAKRLFTSNVIEFKGTKILGRLFFYSYLKYFSEKNARVSITASDVTQNIISESEPHIYR